MSKEKKNKNKIEKNSSNFSEGGFDKSILSVYSQWREDYSEKEISEEVFLESTEEKETDRAQEVDKVDDLDFKSNLINSEVEDHTFSTDEEKPKEDLIVEKERDNKEENNEEDEILTETQRLQLIYGNVVPLHERRRRGSKASKSKNKEKNKEKKSEVIETVKNEEKKPVEEKVEEISPENLENIKAEKQEKDKKHNKIKKETKTVEKSKESKKTKEEKDKKEEKKYEMPKIPKILKLVFAFTIILALSVVGFFGLKAYHSIDVKLPTILSGVESKKIGFYTSNIFFNGKSIDKDQAEYLISTFEEDKTKFKIIEKWLKEDAENLKKDENYKSDRPVRLQKSGKILGLFDDYKICLDPIKLKVEKNDEVQTTIFLNGKEEEISDKEYELFPGKYTIFYYDNNIKLKEEVTLFYDENSNVKTISYGAGTEYQLANEVEKLDTNSNESSFKIVTRDENSILFVNDKNTELTVKEFNKLSGTNIKKGDILKVVTKMPWGYTISDGVTYQGERKVNVSTPLSDKRLLDVAISRTIELLREDVQSRGKKDASLLTTMINPSLQIEAKRVESLINNGREYIGGYPSMEFDLNSFEIREYGDTYEMYIGGHLLVQETTYPQNSKPPKLESITPTESTVGFHFIYDKQKKNWYSNVWGFTTRTITRDNIKSVDISKDMIAR
ncbi:hypothetical protein [Parvimonas micra]|uniref:hypothetical protein n=1 Tax=Parvimonas micra TaxID=33033 RepID=UPI000423B56F|nr:hypothetical protein [Parvimonas micra]